MGMVSFAIADAAIEAGAEIACGVPVAAVTPGEGVELEDGTAIRAAERSLERGPEAPLGMLERRRRVPTDFATGSTPGRSAAP